MSQKSEAQVCQVCQEYDLFPEAYVVHLSGQCCRCAEAQPEVPCAGWGPCGKCKDCASLNQSVVVRTAECCDLCYTHEFEEQDFACGKIPCHAKRLSLKLKKHEKDGKDGEKETWYSACVVLTFSAQSNGGEKQEKPPTPATWYRPRIADCCNIGQLRRHNANDQCAWPKAIWVNGTPTPDYVAPQPEWFRGNPDDLNDAPFWPSLDIDLMEDSPEAPVRYFNGELQLRIKDIGSDGFGVPWGHTRVYSNRLSNSFDFGNGYNWMVHEWPQLVRRKTDPKEVKELHPTVVSAHQHQS